MHFARIAARDCGVDVLEMAGGGAAGGLAAGLVACAGATIEPGFDVVAEATGLEAKIAAADLVVTGEGRLDAQTAYGKTASGVAALARRHGKRVAVIAGSVDAGYDASGGAFDLVESVLRSRGCRSKTRCGMRAQLVAAGGGAGGAADGGGYE